MNDWPDRYIHTTAICPENIDATKLERAVSSVQRVRWFLANLTARRLSAAVSTYSSVKVCDATAVMLERRSALPSAEQGVLENTAHGVRARRARLAGTLVTVPPAMRATRQRISRQLAAMSKSDRCSAKREPPGAVYVRNVRTKGSHERVRLRLISSIISEPSAQQRWRLQ
jgi:hypothetical protein